MSFERFLRLALVAIAITGLSAGILAFLAGRTDLANLCWTLATAPVVVGLAVSIMRDLLTGRFGVDAIALVSMSAAIVLGQPLAGAVVALMYSGGNVLEDIAVARAEHDLRSLVDRAPREAHRRVDSRVEEVPIGAIAVDDQLLVHAGEVVPVDGVVTSSAATIDESALTGEPIPVVKAHGAAILSGSLNAGETFDMTVTSVAGESTYAGIVRLVTAAQTAKAPFVRLADRYALMFLPVTRAHAVLFDKTGTLTVGGARLLSVEVAPGETADEVLMLGASLEQASHHVVANAIVQAGTERGLSLKVPEQVREAMGSGLRGVIEGRRVAAGSRDLIFAGGHASEWASRATRRASWRSALIVFVAVEGRPIGALLLADELRSDTPRAIRLLREAGIARIIMVTGDRAGAAQAIGAALDLDSVLAERVPSDKVDAVLSEQRLHPTIMVGDGINDAPALAAADVGIALGARGASASSEVADVVILADRLDRVGEAIAIAQRARRIAIESIVAGMALSVLAMLAGTLGWLLPVPAAILQEVIDVAVILNALRALSPGHGHAGKSMTAAAGRELHRNHLALIGDLDRLRSIVDALDDATAERATALIAEANQVVQEQVVAHERDDEGNVYPQLAKVLRESHGLSAMSRAHREILHLARLLARVAEDLPSEKVDRYLIRDAQRLIEAVETLVRLHTAQEEDIYEAVAAR